MTRQEKNIKKILIFDLDGVLINSKTNMKKSWESVQRKFSYKEIKFKKYFNEIGIPFEEILKNLKIFKNHKQIKKCYDETSIKNNNLIKFYRGVKKELKILYSLNYELCVVTSKDKKRTHIALKDISHLFTYIQCPQKNLKGKPYPDQILKLIKKIKLKKKECVYIGDTHVDYLTSKNAKIDFIFANWGYGNNNKLYTSSINRISELKIKIN